METISLIAALQNTNARKEKEALLDSAFRSGNREFFRGAQLAYDPLVTFGVKKVAMIEGEDDGQGHYPMSEFLGLTERLSERQLTGHAARDAINAAAALAPLGLWNSFYRRVLLKDLKLGITEGTINRVLKRIGDEALQYVVEVFGTQLAKDGNDPKNAKKLKGKKFLDLKLDGVRLLTVFDKEEGTVIQYSREGIILNTFPHLIEKLTPLLDMIPGSIVLDGEVVSSSFQDLMKQLQRKAPDADNAKLALFDIIPLADFRAGYCEMQQWERHEVLVGMAGILQELAGGDVYVLPKVLVDLETPEGKEAFREFNIAAIEAEYEGIMAKDVDAPYEGKRTEAWLKFKPYIELTLTATAIHRGDDETKYQHTMGAVTFEGIDEGKSVKVNVGSGFSDEDRDEIFANPELYIGMLGEIRADALSLAQNVTVYSMRFPRFKGWRGRVPGEKL